MASPNTSVSSLPRTPGAAGVVVLVLFVVPPLPILLSTLRTGAGGVTVSGVFVFLLRSSFLGGVTMLEAEEMDLRAAVEASDFFTPVAAVPGDCL